MTRGIAGSQVTLCGELVLLLSYLLAFLHPAFLLNLSSQSLLGTFLILNGSLSTDGRDVGLLLLVGNVFISQPFLLFLKAEASTMRTLINYEYNS